MPARASRIAASKAATGDCPKTVKSIQPADRLKAGSAMRLDDKSVGMATMKILFSHVQVMAIAASFKLSWPESLLQMFNTMGSVSTVSADVLSLDCMLQ